MDYDAAIIAKSESFYEGFSETINLSLLASQKSSNHVKKQNRKSPSNRPAEGSEGRRDFEFGE